MMSDEKSPSFKTRDLPFATVLLYFDYPLVGIDKSQYTEKGRIYFIFEQDPNLPPFAHLNKMFKTKKLRLEPNEYYLCYRTLRTAIYANTRNTPTKSK